MRANQYYSSYFTGTQAAYAEFIAEEPLRAGPLYLPEAGSLCQDRKPFGDPDLVIGLGQRHLGDATPLQSWTPAYDAWAVIQMNNLVIGLTPYLPPYPYL
jgi:hypothetical protein